VTLPIVGVLSNRGTLHAAVHHDGRATHLVLCGKFITSPERRRWDPERVGVCEVCRAKVARL
jgi:hypothetical protein